ncbi:MAG: hypothetical protein H0U07_05200 [Actinobacteria bacterium]|nr:hypothetical protein [Actinomycetota bacterium]
MAAAVLGTLGQSRSSCASAGPGPARAMDVLQAVERGTRPCGVAHLVAKDLEERGGVGARGAAAFGAVVRETISSRPLLFRGVETVASWTGRVARAPFVGPASTAIGGACMSAAAAGESTLGSAAGVSRGVSSTIVVGPASGVGAAAAAVAGAAAADLAVVVVAGAGWFAAVHVADCEVGTCVVVDGEVVAGAIGA